MPDRPLQAQQDTIRLPVYDIEGFRADWPRNDQTLINCFAEVLRNPVTGEGEIITTKRSGIARTTAIDVSGLLTTPVTLYPYPIANYVIPNLYDVYIGAWMDAQAGVIRIIQYRPQTGTTRLLGSITRVNEYDKVYISHGWHGDPAAPDTVLMITWEGGSGVSTKGFIQIASGGQFTAGGLLELSATAGAGKSQAVNYPSVLGKLTRGPILQLNNQFYVATIDGKIYGTGTVTQTGEAYVDRSDVSVPGAEKGWTNNLNFIVSLVPDQFHAIMRYKHHILALGKTSIQFFSDTGGSLSATGGGVAITATDQAFIKFGVLSGYHAINVDDIVYWIAYGKDNTIGLWKLEGYTPVKVSTKKQDNEIRQMASNNSFSFMSQLFTIVIGNKKHIGCFGMFAYSRAYSNEIELSLSTATQANLSFEAGASYGMYSLEDKTWWYMNIGNDITFFCPCVAFGNPISPSYDIQAYTQYVLKGDPTGTTSSSFYIYKVTEGIYLDDHSNNNDTTGQFVASSVQFGTVNFGTEKRKRVNKAKVIMAANIPVNNADTNVYGMSIVYSRNNTTYYDT